MRRYPLDPKVREIWRIYPLRILGESVSKCCSEPTMLVQSKQGGFVTQNCSKCGKSTTLPEHFFKNEIDLWVACPECRRRMEPQVLDDKNYGYVCDSCEISIRLSELLPHWNDIGEQAEPNPSKGSLPVDHC